MRWDDLCGLDRSVGMARLALSYRMEIKGDCKGLNPLPAALYKGAALPRPNDALLISHANAVRPWNTTSGLTAEQSVKVILFPSLKVTQ